MENGDHEDIEDECSLWAGELVSTYHDIDIVAYVLEDIQAIFSDRGAVEAADLRARIDSPDLTAASTRITAILIALIFEQPDRGRAYLAGKDAASERIATAVDLATRYSEGP